MKEPDFDAMIKGRTAFLPPRFMTVSTAASQLLEVSQSRENPAFNEDTLCVGMARLGSSTQFIGAGTLQQLASCPDDVFGEPLHCMVICGECHEMEMKYLEQFRFPSCG